MTTSNTTPILMTISRGGWTIYYAEGADHSQTCRSGYGDWTAPGHHGDSVREMLQQNVPTIDTRTIPDDQIVKFTVSGPLVAQGKPDPLVPNTGLVNCGYHSLAYAPVSHYIALALHFGATMIDKTCLNTDKEEN